MSQYVNMESLQEAARDFGGGEPFDHAVIDDFFLPEVAAGLEAEFPALTYRVFDHLNSPEFIGAVSDVLDISAPVARRRAQRRWLAHPRAGRQAQHPPRLQPAPQARAPAQAEHHHLPQQRVQTSWGGQLGLWAPHPEKRGPGELVKSVDPLFNRAVLFDTTQNSWHGLPAPLECPEGQTRRSMAAYYLTPAPSESEDRGKPPSRSTPRTRSRRGVS